jgi:hypothetical protein
MGFTTQLKILKHVDSAITGADAPYQSTMRSLEPESNVFHGVINIIALSTLKRRDNNSSRILRKLPNAHTILLSAKF